MATLSNDGCFLAQARNIKSSDGLAALMAALTTFRSDEQVQAAGCEGLGGIPRTTASLNDALEAGAIDAIVAAANAHTGVAGVQRCACRALQATKDHVAYKERAGEAGALDFIAQAMMQFPNDANLQRDASYALFCLMTPPGHVANRQRAEAAGVRAALAQATENPLMGSDERRHARNAMAEMGDAGGSQDSPPPPLAEPHWGAIVTGSNDAEAVRD
jgi:hypothetical protein